MTLDILVSTFEDGIYRIPHLLLPPQEGIRYVVSFQYRTADWKEKVSREVLERNDVTVTYVEGQGLSENRNNCLQHALADILLIADDDCRYDMGGIKNILNAFKETPSADILLFQSADYDGVPLSRYPETSFDYSQRVRGYWPRSVEMAMRCTAQLPRFDRRFGLGSDFLGSGEEEIFLEDAQRKGLKIIYIPSIIVRTNRNTTGTRFNQDEKARRSKGAVLCYQHGVLSAILRCVKFAMFHVRGMNPFVALRDMLLGIKYIKQSF